jgi:MSHA biogenesis protein MshJ
MTPRERWQALSGRFAALARREKLLVAVAAVGGSALLGAVLLVEPQTIVGKSARRAIEQTKSETATLEVQLIELRERLKADPDAARKAELATLQARLQTVLEGIAAQRSTMVPPEHMHLVLETLLQKHPALRLTRLKSLPPVSLLDKPAAAKSGEGKVAGREIEKFEIYRHGIEVRVEGSYADLYGYLRTLEAHPQRLIWDEAKLEAEHYPTVALTVRLYTLGADKAWIAL